MEMPDDWEQRKSRLCAVFAPKAIRFRFAGPVRRTAEGKLLAQVVAYVPVHLLQARLDKVVGLENWTYSWTPLAVAPDGAVLSAKGSLSLLNLPPKEGLGEQFPLSEPGETAVSEALRTCSLMWGVGRYLKGLDLWEEVSSPDPRTWMLTEAAVTRLQARLPRPPDSAPAAAVPASAPAEAKSAAFGGAAHPLPAGSSAPAVEDVPTVTKPSASETTNSVAIGEQGGGAAGGALPRVRALFAGHQETAATAGGPLADMGLPDKAPGPKEIPAVSAKQPSSQPEGDQAGAQAIASDSRDRARLAESPTPPYGGPPVQPEPLTGRITAEQWQIYVDLQHQVHPEESGPDPQLKDLLSATAAAKMIAALRKQLLEQEDS